MDCYGAFARVYDELMDETPYGKWRDRITAIIEEYGVSKPARGLNSDDALSSEKNLVLDLGCGTGSFTKLMYDAGFDMIGLDSSEGMLELAIEKRDEAGDEILYLNQDMRRLDLYSTVGTVVSVCDSINYITEPSELLDVFKLVNKFLFPGGLFIFDFNTEYKYRVINGDSTFAENREDVSFIWENFYDEETGLNEFDLTLFIKDENGVKAEDDRFIKYEETHIQRGYTVSEIEELIGKAGLKLISMTDADTDGDVREISERILVVAKEVKKDKA